MSVLGFRVTGKAEEDLRPVNGATMLACAGVERFTVATVADDIMDEAIFSLYLFSLYFFISFFA